jgi:hypothetical protein
MSQLKDYPLVLEAVRNIALDTGLAGIGVSVNREAEIPPGWEICFRAVETTFADIDKRYERLTSLGWKLKTKAWWEEVNVVKGARTLYWVWVPVDHSAEDILYACGCSDAQVYCVQTLMREYFDGELRDVLEVRK